MRTLLFILLLSSQSFGQILKDQAQITFPEKVDSIVLGNWVLKETLIEPAFRYDSIPTIREANRQNRTITFTEDSLIIHPYTKRYYTRNEKYQYEIDGSDLKLFQGKKRKRQEIRSFSILKYSPRELVLGTQETISNPFDFNVLTVCYVYHRVEKNEEYQTLLNSLRKKWEICSGESIPFLLADTAVTLNFRVETIDSNLADPCGDFTHKIGLSPYSDEFNFKNGFSTYWQSGVVGSGTILFFYLDSQLENIIFPDYDGHVAYRIVKIDSDQLTLELNTQLTGKLNR